MLKSVWDWRDGRGKVAWVETDDDTPRWVATPLGPYRMGRVWVDWDAAYRDAEKRLMVETTPTDIRGTVEAISAGAYGKRPASSAQRKRSGESRRARFDRPDDDRRARGQS